MASLQPSFEAFTGPMQPPQPCDVQGSTTLQAQRAWGLEGRAGPLTMAQTKHSSSKHAQALLDAALTLAALAAAPRLPPDVALNARRPADKAPAAAAAATASAVAAAQVKLHGVQQDIICMCGPTAASAPNHRRPSS